MHHISISLLLAALFAALPAFTADRFEPIRDFIRRQLVETQAPSIAVAVAKDGKIIWEEGFGWANRENRTPADENTMYSLASISKPITATGLMTLVHAGKIDLDKPLNDYLGAAKMRARIGDVQEATVRTVANHSSGLPLHYQFFYADEHAMPASPDETILRFANLLTLPGEHYQYSNLGFGILDYVISRVSGKAYPDYMREEVFLKLGLTHTCVYTAPGLEKWQAIRYGSDGLPIPLYTFDHSGASALYASAHDLVRFGMFHLKSHLGDQVQILPDALIDGMQKPTMRTGPDSHYGIGWAIEDQSGYRVVSHTGGMPGVATALRIVPSERLAVVVLCNSANRLPHRLADQIMADLLPNWKPSSNRPAEPRSDAQFQPPKELLGVWKGRVSTYQTDMPFTLRILETGDVHVELGDQLKTLLNHVRYQDGFLGGRMTGRIPLPDAARRPYSLSLNLKLRGGTVLSGAVSALSEESTRTGYALTQWAELTRQ